MNKNIYESSELPDHTLEEFEEVTIPHFEMQKQLIKL
jgi:hypothetical protein